jgi:hypothetical protein
MRPVRIVLVFIALIAVGLAGWALGNRGGYGQPGADPAIAEAPSAPDDQAAREKVAGGGNAPSVTAPSGGGGTTSGGPDGGVSEPPATRPPKPVIESISTVPRAPFSGGYLHLDPGPGEVTFRVKIRNATRALFWIAPADAKGDIKPVWLGEDRNGRDGWTTRLWYNSQPLFEQVLVVAVGPGGRDEATFGVTSEAGGAEVIEEEGTQEVTEEQTAPEEQKATEDQQAPEDQKP